nr:alkaline phosphatase [uncultured Desulfobacter sp.]
MLNLNKKVLKAGIIVTVCLFSCTLCFNAATAKSRTKRNKANPKYIFYFIGDGMASVQIHAAEAYLAQLAEGDDVEGGTKADLLSMSTEFPVQGMSTTFANNRFITGSAAAGTALACGMKTNINVISMDPATTVSYNSLAEKAKDAGMKVGIISSVTINHATPAVFYSHTATRKNYSDIANQLATSPFDFFGGGYWNNSGEDGAGMAEETAVANGFTITHNLTDLQAQANGAKVIAFDSVQDAGGHTGALYYDMDRATVNGMSLADFTAEGIRIIDNNDKGFFMMVEGGKIDWACHANDARAAIDDTIAFDDAIKEAIKFYNDHPNETLIVVTGDHECGGMTLGFANTGYETAFEILANQTVSYEYFDAHALADYITANVIKDEDGNVTSAPADIDAEMWQIIFTYFGLDGNNLSASEDDDFTEYEIEKLEAAFDKTMSGTSVNTGEEDSLLYGYYEPLSVTLTHILNNKAGIAFTSYSHTGVPVMVLAKGKNASIFDGFYDNTDIAKKIAQVMRVNLNN